MANSQLDLNLIALEAAVVTADDNATFLNALDTIQKLADATAIPRLLLILDDNHKYQEWMWSIMHVAEGFVRDDSVYIRHLVPALTKLSARSPEWANILLLRVLNHRASLEQLRRYISLSTDADKLTVRQIVLSLIEEDKQRFEISGNLILDAIQGI